jgi:hypothetical protein
VQIEVYYSPKCINCLSFLHLGVLPLLEARIPGQQVAVTVLPLPSAMGLEAECALDAECQTHVAPLCALKADHLPLPVDSHELLSAVRFLECDLAHTVKAGSLSVEADTVRTCANMTGLHYEKLHACTQGPEALQITRSATYQEKAREAIRRLRSAGIRDRVQMPLVFLNGELLDCQGGACFAKKTQTGDRPLANPGSLLHVVCTLLTPPPEACRITLATEGVGVRVAQTQRCENCVEIGGFRWPAVHGQIRANLLGSPLALWGAVFGTALCASLLVGMKLRSRSLILEGYAEGLQIEDVA